MPLTDGSAYLASSSTGATYQTGQDTVVRQQFVNNGKLANTQDTNFRAVSNNWPVFGIAHDLGTVSSTASSPAVFVVGHARDPAIQYITAGGVLQSRSSYFWSAYSSAAAAVRCISAFAFHGKMNDTPSLGRSPRLSATTAPQSRAQTHLMFRCRATHLRSQLSTLASSRRRSVRRLAPLRSQSRRRLADTTRLTC